jgi:hypothetical protein
MFKGIIKTTTFCPYSKRSFYFKATRPSNSDFPLNIGFNNDYDLDKMSMKS